MVEWLNATRGHWTLWDGERFIVAVQVNRDGMFHVMDRCGPIVGPLQGCSVSAHSTLREAKEAAKTMEVDRQVLS
jgi:hypothetical protein